MQIRVLANEDVGNWGYCEMAFKMSEEFPTSSLGISQLSLCRLRYESSLIHVGYLVSWRFKLLSTPKDYIRVNIMSVIQLIAYFIGNGVSESCRPNTWQTKGTTRSSNCHEGRDHICPKHNAGGGNGM